MTSEREHAIAWRRVWAFRALWPSRADARVLRHIRRARLRLVLLGR